MQVRSEILVESDGKPTTIKAGDVIFYNKKRCTILIVRKPGQTLYWETKGDSAHRDDQQIITLADEHAMFEFVKILAGSHGLNYKKIGDFQYEFTSA